MCSSVRGSTAATCCPSSRAGTVEVERGSLVGPGAWVACQRLSAGTNPVAAHEAVHKGGNRSSQAGVLLPSNHAEAEQRIDAAKRGNEEVLDLSGLRLKDIP